MNRLYKHMAAMAMAYAMMAGGENYYDTYGMSNPMNNYHPVKVGGFTECKGRKRLSKKKRKEINKR